MFDEIARKTSFRIIGAGYRGMRHMSSNKPVGNLADVKSVKLRVPPTADAKKASATLKQILERDPPYGARVSYEGEKEGSGWNAPATAPWLEAALEDASHAAWGKPMAMMGEGGSIPFMGMLGEKFPEAQFVVTGVLGPHSNAHGPNEFLHIPTGKRVTETVARVLAAHAQN